MLGNKRRKTIYGVGLDKGHFIILGEVIFNLKHFNLITCTANSYKIEQGSVLSFQTIIYVYLKLLVQLMYYMNCHHAFHFISLIAQLNIIKITLQIITMSKPYILGEIHVNK